VALEKKIAIKIVESVVERLSSDISIISEAVLGHCSETAEM
jgi:hypothetical protein